MSDDVDEMRGVALETAILEDRKKGLIPFFVGSRPYVIFMDNEDVRKYHSKCKIKFKCGPLIYINVILYIYASLLSKINLKL